MDYSMNGRSQSTIGNRHPTALQGVYPCSGEDQWVAITIFDDRDWELFCEAIGNPEWAGRGEFATHVSRREHHDDLDRMISDWTRGHGHREVMGLLQSHGVAAGAVLNQRDAFEDPHLLARGCSRRRPRTTWELTSTRGRHSRCPAATSEYGGALSRWDRTTSTSIRSFSSSQTRSMTNWSQRAT